MWPLWRWGTVSKSNLFVESDDYLRGKPATKSIETELTLTWTLDHATDPEVLRNTALILGLSHLDDTYIEAVSAAKGPGHVAENSGLVVEALFRHALNPASPIRLEAIEVLGNLIGRNSFGTILTPKFPRIEERAYVEATRVPQAPSRYLPRFFALADDKRSTAQPASGCATCSAR